MARIFGAGIDLGIDSRARSDEMDSSLVGAFIGSILLNLIAVMERRLLNNACIEVALHRPMRQPEGCFILSGI